MNLCHPKTFWTYKKSDVQEGLLENEIALLKGLEGTADFGAEAGIVAAAKRVTAMRIAKINEMKLLKIYPSVPLFWLFNLN